MNTLKEGDKVPDFSSVDQDGNLVKLSDYSGKKLVVFFIQGLIPRDVRLKLVIFGIIMLNSNQKVTNFWGLAKILKKSKRVLGINIYFHFRFWQMKIMS